MTEQGEVIQSKYKNADIGGWHLELLVSATLEASVTASTGAQDNHMENFAHAMDNMSVIAEETYRQLVYGTKGFNEYFFAATPIHEIAGLNIGPAMALLPHLAVQYGNGTGQIRPCNWQAIQLTGNPKNNPGENLWHD